ncbi:MAG: hypothetical protein LC800_23300, partial [Acidobacteria bacterium]|nr:hypothetical protein [Acidobacteriota bacterium]
LYVSFMSAPLIQKYSPGGALLFERRLEGEQIERLTERSQTNRLFTTAKDGVDSRLMSFDPVVDPSNGNLLVFLVDGSIYVADQNGEKVSILSGSLDNKLNRFTPYMAGVGGRGEVIVVPFQYKRCYRLVPSGENADVQKVTNQARPSGKA